jgi:predicted ATPase
MVYAPRVATSNGYRLAEVRIQGMRTLADVRLPLGGLTVLIGDNGSGKSTIVEALELLRKVGEPGLYVQDQLGARHGGLGSLLRVGERSLTLSAKIEGGKPIDYSVSFAMDGSFARVAEEVVHEHVRDLPIVMTVLQRSRAGCQVFYPDTGEPQDLEVPAAALAVAASIPLRRGVPQDQHGDFLSPTVAPRRILDVLSSGYVAAPFDVLSLWLTTERQRRTPMREPSPINVAPRLDRFGDNLASCFAALKERHPAEVWALAMDRVRRGLGDDVLDVRTPAAARGLVELELHFRGLAQPIPAAQLSDGQLAYLSFVALVTLAEQGAGMSFVAVDEPELHLHPHLLRCVVGLLVELARTCPVVIATHSDRLLDLLPDPASQVVLCELDETRATKLWRPNAADLASWLERYQGFGSIRADGYERQLMTEPLVVDPAP